jgi:hypothetical protein
MPNLKFKTVPKSTFLFDKVIISLFLLKTVKEVKLSPGLIFKLN